MVLDALVMVDFPRDIIQKDVTAYIEKELIPGKKVDEPRDNFSKDELKSTLEFVILLLKLFRKNKTDVKCLKNWIAEKMAEKGFITQSPFIILFS